MAEDVLSFETVYQACATADRGCYAALKLLNDAMTAGRFDAINAGLPSVRLDWLSAEAILAIASMLYHAKDKLPNRPAYLTAAKARLIVLVGAERAEKLISSRF